MKKFFIDMFSSGPKTAGVLIFIAFIFVMIFLEDNKATMHLISSNKELSPQEEILKTKKEIEALELKLETLKTKEEEK